uniref:Uncharacterized protein n=1 Tax=viral metagenome TaxID=1070528 RepID=A0A6C0B111_9ZZZZ
MISTSIHQLQDFVFNLFIFLNYFLYGLFSIGLAANAPQYLDSLDYYVKIYISIFLLWRFNPFRSIQFTNLDRKIVFSSGLFLFSTTVINQILISYLTNIKQSIKSLL